MNNEYKRIARESFSQFNSREVNDFIFQFTTFDADGNGNIDTEELAAILQNIGEEPTPSRLRSLISEIDADNSGTIEFDEFMQLIVNIRSGGGGDMGQVYQKASRKIRIGGHSDSTEHSFDEDERHSFVQYINASLADDEHVGARLPMDPDDMSVFEAVEDGLLLCKLINDAVPGTIDERVLNTGRLNKFTMTENQNLAINSAKAIGCSVINISAEDLMEGAPKAHLCLGLLWQIIKIGLLSRINLTNHPELYRLLEPGESLEDFLKLPPDQILLRWFNYHLANAGHNRRVTNFSGDIRDGENYTVLLHQLAPAECDLSPLDYEGLDRAEKFLENAEIVDCRRFVTARDIVRGNPKLNLAFVANLFNAIPGLEALDETERAALDDFLFNSEGDREARAFALWINSLGVEPFVYNLYEDLRDGIVLLKTFDIIEAGMVRWRGLTKVRPMMKFKALENCGRCIEYGGQLGFSLVGVGGVDINNGNQLLTLALVWQMMRYNVITMLQSLATHGQITEDEMIDWANNSVQAAGGRNTMESFRDSSLSNGLFFLDLVNSIRPGTVDYDLVTPGNNEEDAILNAKYSISIARKLGATIFLLPEDIWEVKPKMILTFVGAIMACSS